MKNKIYYTKGKKYQLYKNFSIQIAIRPEVEIKTDYINLTTSGILKIKKGYTWDGPSGPVPDFKILLRASLVHDALYELIREEKLPVRYFQDADFEFKRICLEDEVSKPLTSLMFIALSMLGKIYLHFVPKTNIKTAP